MNVLNEVRTICWDGPETIKHIELVGATLLGYLILNTC